MRTFVVGDAHGRHRLVRRLLEEAGIVDGQGARIRERGVATVQTGDLIHATAETRLDDAAILRNANAWFDVCLVGNHEYPYLGGFGFGGFCRLNEIDRLVYNVSWHPAVAIGGTLVTHAGVAELLGVRSSSASAAARELAEAWLADRQHPFFAACSPARAGGKDFVGGILWKDWREQRSLEFSQVHGHTPQPDGPVFVGDREGVFCANLDVGARARGLWLSDRRPSRVCGLWLDDDGRPGDYVVAEALDGDDAVEKNPAVEAA